MSRKRYTAEQIISMLREAEVALSALSACLVVPPDQPVNVGGRVSLDSERPVSTV